MTGLNININPTEFKNGLVENLYQESGSAAFQQMERKFQPETRLKQGQHFNVNLITENKEVTPLNALFFSSKNIQALQEGIRYGVFKYSKSKYIVSEQPINELVLIMRGVYLQYALHLPFNIVEQVRELNAHVLNFAIPEVIKAKQAHEIFLKHQSTLPTPIKAPVNTSIKGHRVLESRGFI